MSPADDIRKIIRHIQDELARSGAVRPTLAHLLDRLDDFATELEYIEDRDRSHRLDWAFNNGYNDARAGVGWFQRLKWRAGSERDSYWLGYKFGQEVAKDEQPVRH